MIQRVPVFCRLNTEAHDLRPSLTDFRPEGLADLASDRRGRAVYRDLIVAADLDLL